MRVKITCNQDSLVFETEGLLPEDVASLWQTITKDAPFPLPDPPIEDEAPATEGRAVVGQVIPRGTKFLDMPPGVKVLDEGSNGVPCRYRHVYDGGARFTWSDSLQTPDPSEFLDTGALSTLWANMTVLEVW